MKLRTEAPPTDADYQRLYTESGIERSTIEQFRLYRVTSEEGRDLVGRNDHADYSGLVFPVYWPGEIAPREEYLRRDHPEFELKNGTPKPTRRYLAPPGRPNILLFGPGESPSALSDPSTMIMIVEGLKKVVAGWQVARWDTNVPRFVACGVTGVFNFRGTIGKMTDEHGARVDLKGPIPDLDRIVWKGRTVFLVYDSDALTNASVSAARELLAEELRSRGATVLVMYLPTLKGLTKTGFDDALAQWGPERVLAWLQSAQTQAAASADDPELIPLDEFNVPRVQTHMIPVPWLRDIIDAIAAATETPTELGLMIGLGVIATCAQGKYEVEPERGYKEPTNLWQLVFLDSGNRKTAVMRTLTRPLLDFERAHEASHARAIADAEAMRRLAEDRIKHLRQKAARAEGTQVDALRQELLLEEAALPHVPLPLRLWAQDITPERLGPLMADHGQKMALLSDEGGIFDILAGRYSQGIPNLDLILQAYSGAPYRVDRGSRPPVFMEHPLLTIALSPQPVIMKGVTQTPSFRGRGLLARFLYAIPPSMLGFRTLDTRPISDDLREAYHAQVHALLKLAPRGDGHPHCLQFSDEAHREWKAFSRDVEARLRPGGALEPISDWGGKLPGQVARIAGVLHCARHVTPGPEHFSIELSTMEAALELGAILEVHALKAFGLMAVDSPLEAAQKIWNWAQRHRQTTFTKRNCYKGVQSATFPTVASIEPALGLLVDRGYLIPVPHAPGPGRPSPTYRVNRYFQQEWIDGMA